MDILIDILIAPALFGLLLIAQEIGYRAGYRTKERTEGPASGQVGAVQGAVLGLLGLLLGFSFAGAGTRFIERQDLIVREANAIGTAYLRAGMLAEPHRAALRTALRDYTEHRIQVSRTLRSGLSTVARDEIDTHHQKIWTAAIEGSRADATVGLLVLPPVNEVLDVHSLRIAAGRKHLPVQILGLLIGCSVVAMGVMGYGSGLAGRRTLLLLSALIILIGTALWTTIDLDHPRVGLLKLSDAPLEALEFN